MRASGTPIEIGDAGVGRLRRVGFSERTFNEAWFQRLVHENPSLLPVDELRPVLGELTSLGREIATPVGPIDNLFVDPAGTLVVVEAKLWRNPEARREVVGQVLEYAGALSRWGFEDLDAAVMSSNAGLGLLDLVSPAPHGEAAFVDGVERSLRTGDMVLLIVGDGIRTGLEGIGDLLAGAPHLGFTFGLVELAVYETTSGSRLVVPSVVAHSVEITRAVVRVEASGDRAIAVEVAALGDDEQARTPRGRRKLDAGSFVRDLAANVDASTFEAVMEWRALVESDPQMFVDYATTSMVFRLQPADFSRAFPALFIHTDGTVSVGYLLGAMNATGLPIEIAARYASESAELVGAPRPDRWPDTWGQRVSVQEALTQRDALMGLMRRMLAEIETAGR